MESLFSKENSNILRGIGILAIMLHNFLHIPQFGLPRENEMSFSEEKAGAFFDMLTSGGWNVIAEWFSFLGWIGVPVFIFLTGYGTAITSSFSNKTINYSSVNYIKKSFLKLFALMLPAVLFFAGIDIIKHEIWPGLFKRFFYLTMSTNLAYPYLKCDPGVYWYFGLTFQFYVLWALFGKKLNNKSLIILSLLFMAGLAVLCLVDAPAALSIYRHCFTGWFFIFAIGVYFGNRKGNGEKELSWNLSVFVWLLLAIVLFAMVVLMNKWLATWLFVPVVALGMFYAAGKVILRMPHVAKIFRWFGGLSACIFVCHPIARLIVIRGVYPHVSNLLLITLVYIVVSIVLAMGYERIYKWLLGRLIPSK